VPQDYLDGLEPATWTPGWMRTLGATDWPRAGVFILLDDTGTVVGFAHLCASRDATADAGVGEVTAIYLAPQVWRRGGGRMLMEAALETLGDAGFVSVILWVLDSNSPARQFYEALGFRTDGASAALSIGGADLTELRYSMSLRG
jgi:GNAT superfamily N-acetyltransferase